MSKVTDGFELKEFLIDDTFYPSSDVAELLAHTRALEEMMLRKHRHALSQLQGLLDTQMRDVDTAREMARKLIADLRESKLLEGE